MWSGKKEGSLTGPPAAGPLQPPPATSRELGAGARSPPWVARGQEGQHGFPCGLGLHEEPRVCPCPHPTPSSGSARAAGSRSEPIAPPPEGASPELLARASFNSQLVTGKKNNKQKHHEY